MHLYCSFNTYFISSPHALILKHQEREYLMPATPNTLISDATYSDWHFIFHDVLYECMLNKNDLKKIKTVVDESVKKQIKPIATQIKKMDKKLDLTITYFDRITTKNEKRVKRLEENANLPQIPEFA